MKILILKSKKTSARKYSATPVSKPSHAQTKAGQDIVSVFLFMQNSRHTLHLHMKNCGASFERFLYHSIQLNNRISCTTQASRLRGLFSNRLHFPNEGSQNSPRHTAFNYCKGKFLPVPLPWFSLYLRH